MSLVEKLLVGAVLAVVLMFLASMAAYHNYSPSQKEVSAYLVEEGLP